MPIFFKKPFSKKNLSKELLRLETEHDKILRRARRNFEKSLKLDELGLEDVLTEKSKKK